MSGSSTDRSPDPDLWNEVGWAQLQEVALLGAEERYSEALAASDAALRWLEEHSPSEASSMTQAALRKQAWLLQELGRTQEAIASHELQSTRHDEDPAPYAREHVAIARERLAEMLLDERRNDEVIAVADDLSRRLAETDGIKVRRHVAAGLSYKALALEGLGRLDDAIAVDDQTIERFSGYEDPELEDTLAHVLGHKAWCLKQSGRRQESRAAWSELATRYGTSTQPTVRSLVERALLEKAKLAALAGDPDETIVLADSLIARAGEEPARPGQESEARVARAVGLAAAERYEEALEILDDLIDRHSDNSAADSRDDVARALLVKLGALEGLGLDDEAKLVFDSMIDEFADELLWLIDDTIGMLGDAAGAQEREELAGTLLMKAIALGKLNRQDEALQTLGRLISRFEDDHDPELREIVASARIAQHELEKNET